MSHSAQFTLTVSESQHGASLYDSDSDGLLDISAGAGQPYESLYVQVDFHGGGGVDLRNWVEYNNGGYHVTPHTLGFYYDYERDDESEGSGGLEPIYVDQALTHYQFNGESGWEYGADTQPDDYTNVSSISYTVRFEQGLGSFDIYADFTDETVTTYGGQDYLGRYQKYPF